MDRRAFVAGLGAVLTTALGAEAQSSERVYRIGIVSTGQTRSSPLFVAFEQRLHELGYAEGRNLVIEFRGAEGDVGRLAKLTSELVRLNIDLLLTGGPEEAVRTAKQATTRIPIVMVAIDFDPVASGYIAGLARPGGNITGLLLRQVELTAKRMELLKETLPRLTRVAILSDGFAVDQLNAAERATRDLALQAHVLALRTPPYDFENLFGAIVRSGAEAVFVTSSPVFFRERDRIADIALRNRLPTVFAFREWTEVGGLLSYGPSATEMYRRAAEYADKILKGAKPSDLPVQQPTKFELVINLKTAKALGLTIPQSLLLRADQVIE